MRHYRTLTIVPDFREPPVGGVAMRRDDTAIAAAAMFSRFPSRSSRALNLRFISRGPTETSALRAFLLQTRGNWGAFYVPSWYRDFGGVGDITTGSSILTIDRDPSEWLETDRPDTHGRTIYVYSPGGSLHVARILSAVAGSGTWELTLDLPFPFSAEAEECLCGIAWFVHLAGPELTFEHLTPDRCEVDVAVIEGLNYRSSSSTHSIAPVTVYESEPFVSLLEEDSDPWSANADARACVAIGPDEYGEAQDLNFSNSWSFRLAAGVVSMESGAESLTSSLFNGTDAVEMLSGAFDALGTEVLAWQQDFDTIRIRWRIAGTPQVLNFTGRTPVCFQNWTMNGAISAGDGDVVVYYLRRRESKVFARYQRDSFATEYVVAISPILPLALLGNAINGQSHELRALSGTHTRLTFSSDPYQLPPPRARDTAIADEDTSAAVNLMVIDAAATDEAGADDSSAAGSESVAAAVNFMVVDGEAIDDSEASGSETVTGALNFMVIDADGTGEDEISADEALSASYNQIAVDAAGEDTAAATETTSGSYGPP